MRLGTLIGCTLALWIGTLAFGQDPAKPLTGTWTASADAAKDGPTTWVFEQNGDSLKIAEMNGADKLAGFECNTMGKQCEIKEGGKKATVSMWFNGPKLVELETRGSDTIKRRFEVDQKGDELDVEMIPISQGGKPETLHFKRVEVAAHNQ